jgi:hypothetical protein
MLVNAVSSRRVSANRFWLRWSAGRLLVCTKWRHRGISGRNLVARPAAVDIAFELCCRVISSAWKYSKLLQSQSQLQPESCSPAAPSPCGYGSTLAAPTEAQITRPSQPGSAWYRDAIHGGYGQQLLRNIGMQERLFGRHVGGPMTMDVSPTSRHFPISAGIFFGLGLGGFFDGIVLHQVLQWHHMLSSWYPVNTIKNLELNTRWTASFTARHTFSF